MAIHPTGSTRKLDALGRVIIPVDVRDAMKITTGDMMECYVDVNPGGEVVGVYFSKYARGCTFCGGYSDLKQAKGKDICEFCREEITNS